MFKHTRSRIFLACRQLIILPTNLCTNNCWINVSENNSFTPNIARVHSPLCCSMVVEIFWTRNWFNIAIHQTASRTKWADGVEFRPRGMKFLGFQAKMRGIYSFFAKKNLWPETRVRGLIDPWGWRYKSTGVGFNFLNPPVNSHPTTHPVNCCCCFCSSSKIKNWI